MKIEKDTVKVINSTVDKSPIAVRQAVKDSYNVVERMPAGAVQEQLKVLLEQYATIVSQLMPDKAAEAKDNLDSLVKEVAREQPRRKWFELSAEGLIEAAKTVGEMAKPILATVAEISKLLFG